MCLLPTFRLFVNEIKFSLKHFCKKTNYFVESKLSSDGRKTEFIFHTLFNLTRALR